MARKADPNETPKEKHERYRTYARKWYHAHKSEIGDKKSKKRAVRYRNDPVFREAHKKRQKDYYHKNRDKIMARKKTPEWREKERAYRRTIPQSVRYRKHWLKSRYGVTLDWYEKTLLSQNGVCAICKIPQIRMSRWGTAFRNLDVDHVHKTKKVRGLLCHNCNVAIGSFKENITTIQSAIEYLKSHA